MKRLPRKLKKKIKQTPVGNYCYGSAIDPKNKGGCCPYWHRTKDPEIAYCSFLREHNDFELPDQTKLPGCNHYGDYFDSKGHFSKPLIALANRYNRERWQTSTLEGFLIIHENHITGLQTWGGSIFIEDILDVNTSTINAFHHWLAQLPRCKNNIEFLKEHYRLGLKIAKRIKKIVGCEILVDYWWINPADIKKGRKRTWQGLRIEEDDVFSFRKEQAHPGWLPDFPFDIRKATKNQVN